MSGCGVEGVFSPFHVGGRSSVWLTDKKKVILLLLLCGNTVQTFPICLRSVSLPSNSNGDLMFTVMDTVSQETFKSQQVDFYNSLK